jgi:hypothetical protein
VFLPDRLKSRPGVTNITLKVLGLAQQRLLMVGKAAIDRPVAG